MRVLLIALLAAISYAQTDEEEVRGYEDIKGKYRRMTANGYRTFALHLDDFERTDEADGLVVFGKPAVLTPNGAIVHETGHAFYPDIWPDWKVFDWDNQWAIGGKGAMTCTVPSVWIRNSYDKAEQHCLKAASDMGMETDFTTNENEDRPGACWYEVGTTVVRIDGGYWNNPNARMLCRITNDYIYPTKAPTDQLPWCSCYSYPKTWVDKQPIDPAKGTIMCQMRHRGKPHKSCRHADDPRYAETGCPQHMMCRFRKLKPHHG